MSALQAEVYEAFRSLDVPDDKALKDAIALSSALAKVEDETAKGFNRRDADIEAIRKDIGGINKEIGSVNVRMMAMTGEMNLIKWMLGTTLAAVVTVLFRVFTH